MVLYRQVAERLVDKYDYNWGENLRMKEACIYSVESIVANIVNFGVLFVIIALSGLWWEMPAYFVTFAGMRFFAGGAHAKNYTQCISLYSMTMLCCIGCAKYLIPNLKLGVFIIVVAAIFFSGCVNHRWAAGQRMVRSRKAEYHQKAMWIHRIFSAELIIVCGIYMQAGNLVMKELCMIQALALVAQSSALFIGRRECKE